MTLNGELDAFSHTVTPVLGLLALFLPFAKAYRQRLALNRYYAATVLVVCIAYAWQHFEREYRWWESAWSVTFSTHTAVHVAVLSCLWQLSNRWRMGTVVIGGAYAALIVYRRYHTPSDVASTAAAMFPELLLVWWLAQARVGAPARAVPERPGPG